MTQLKKDDAIELATTALLKAGATQAMAASTARALVLADMQGMPSHGLAAWRSTRHICAMAVPTGKR